MNHSVGPLGKLLILHSQIGLIFSLCFQDRKLKIHKFFEWPLNPDLETYLVKKNFDTPYDKMTKTKNLRGSVLRQSRVPVGSRHTCPQDSEL